MRYLTIAVPVDMELTEDGTKYVPKADQPAVTCATKPYLVEADSPEEAAELLASQQRPTSGFPADYIVLSGDAVTVGLVAATK